MGKNIKFNPEILIFWESFGSHEEDLLEDLFGRPFGKTFLEDLFGRPFGRDTLKSNTMKTII
jgi:hypothetical protein